MASAVGSGAAVPFWRAAGMTYISYSNICANLVRNCLKEPFKSEALTREKVHFSISKWDNGVPRSPPSVQTHLKRIKAKGWLIKCPNLKAVIFFQKAFFCLFSSIDLGSTRYVMPKHF
ncbi:hypothetical protein AAG906_039544 [Vitis piasezkii]